MLDGGKMIKNAYPETGIVEDTQIRETATKLAELIMKRSGPSTERDRAILSLRQCLMWANQAIQ